MDMFLLVSLLDNIGCQYIRIREGIGEIARKWNTKADWLGLRCQKDN